MRVCDIKEIRG